MISLSLAKWLQTNSAITALTTEIRPQKLAGGHAHPALIYTVTSVETPRVFGGRSSLSTASFDIDCVARDYSAARELADVVRAELEAHSGPFGDVDGQQIDIVNEQDLFEPQAKYHVVTQSYTIWYSSLEVAIND